MTVSSPYENYLAFMERLKKSSLELPKIAKETRNDCSLCKNYQASMERLKKLSLISIARNDCFLYENYLVFMERLEMQTLENQKKRGCWTLPELSWLPLEGWRY